MAIVDGCTPTADQEDCVDCLEDEDYNFASSDEEDEVEKDLRPSKRQRLSLTSSNENPTCLSPLSMSSKEHLHAPRASRGSSALGTLESPPEYKEWPLQGFLQRVQIGTRTTFSLQFTLDSARDNFEVLAPLEAIASIMGPQMSKLSQTSPKTQRRETRPRRKRAPWTKKEEATLVKMKEKCCSWTTISADSLGSIQVHYSAKLKPRVVGADARSRNRYLS